MRAVIIEPANRQINEVEVGPSYAARAAAIGGSAEIAVEFENGDILLVDANGHSRHEGFFSVGAQQTFAGPGLVVGTSGRNAKTSLAQVLALTTFVGTCEPRALIERRFDSMSEALDFIGNRKRSSAVTLPSVDTTEDAHSDIELHYSLLDVDDADLTAIETDDEDGGWYPHIEIFPKSGLAELISHPVKWEFRITGDGMRWLVPSSISASRLRASLAPGASLRAKLSIARAAALKDAGIYAACELVTAELKQLGNSGKP